MKITDLNVEGFGVWSGFELDTLGDDITVLFGRNEAGKTTLMQFVRAVLYGFSPERRLRYLPPVHGGRPGGVLTAEGGESVLQIRRTARPDDPLGEPGELTVSASDGTRLGPAALTELLAHVDEATFNNVFAIGLTELQELSTLDDAAAAEELYKLTSGLDRVSLLDVINELKTSRSRLLSSSGASRIERLLQQRDLLQAEIEQLSSAASRWAQLAAERQTAQREIAALEDQYRGQDEQALAVEIALEVRPLCVERDQAQQQLNELGPAPPLPERSRERLARYNEKIAVRRKQLAAVKRRRAELRDEAAELPVNQRLWSQAARIEAIGEHAQWIESLQSQIDRLTKEVDSLDLDLQTHCAALGIAKGAASSDLPNINRHTLGMLRRPARALREHKRCLQQARGEAEAARREAEEAALTVETSLADRDHTNLSAALEVAGAAAGQLRRRLQLRDRLEQMERRRTELEERSQDLFERQIAPKGLLIGVGLMIALGAALVFVGIVCWFYAMSGAVLWSLLGLLAAGGALGAKIGIERSSAARLRSCNKQLELLHGQIEEAKQQRDQLDAALPRGGGPLETQLQQAEAELHALEELLPLDTQRQAAQEKRESADQRAAHQEQALREARKRWRGALRSAGLPESVSPKNVRELADNCEQATGLRRRLEARRDELEQRERELDSVTGRIDQLLRDAGLAPAGDLPEQQLRQLTAALAEQQHVIDRRGSLKRRNQRLKSRGRKLMQSLDELRRRRRAFINTTGAIDETEFLRFAEQQAQIDALAVRRDDLSRQISDAIAGRCRPEAVEQAVAGNSAPELEQRWEQLSARTDEWRSRLAKLHTRTGELSQEMKSLAASRRQGEAQLELGCVEQQLRTAIHRWRVLAAAELLLEAVRDRYENERQPEALRDASRYLETITAGQYVRVWTPLDERTLRVDDTEGRSLSLDVLSRGAREAVFLCLRLALASAFARRGAALPLVLDDVLVNFDAERASAAAGLLRQFAADGNQVLLFTCHQHIMELFESHDVEVRTLPDHSGQPVLVAAPAEEEVFDEEDEEEEPAEAWEDEEEEEEYEDEAAEAEEDEEYEEEPVEEDEAEDEEEDEDEYEEEEAPEEVAAESEEEYEEEPDEDEVAAEFDEEEMEDEEEEEDYDLADDEDYALEEEYRLLPESAAEHGEQEECEVAEVEDVEEEPAAELPPPMPGELEHGFTWASPERWSDDDRGDAAA